MFMEGEVLTLLNLYIQSRFGIMTQCWAEIGQDRPTFSDIVALLSQNLEGMSGYIVLLKE